MLTSVPIPPGPADSMNRPAISRARVFMLSIPLPTRLRRLAMPVPLSQIATATCPLSCCNTTEIRLARA